MPQWKLSKAEYTVTGAPVVADDLTGALAGSTLRLLIAGLVLMALVLALVFRSRLRLVPLVVALAAVAITFGATALLGLPLTMASIAVLPVLLGLGVDYAIQYQARVQEEGGPETAARVAVPVIATAALATGVGFLVLLLSPGADGARVRRAAGGRHRDRLRAGADGRDRGALAAPARRRRVTLAARRRRADRRGGADDRAAAGRARDARRRRGGARRAAPAGPRARAGGGARGGRVGARQPDRGGVRHRPARPAGPRRRAGPQDAPAGDRRGRRDRRRRRRPGPHRPGRREVDARLPVRRARALRLLVRARLRARRPVPGAVAARPLPLLAGGRRPRADPHAARRGAALLLARRDHRRPQDGQPRLRRAAHLARAPAGDHPRPARAARPAARRHRTSGRPAGAGRGGERDAVGPAAARRRRW